MMGFGTDNSLGLPRKGTGFSLPENTTASCREGIYPVCKPEGVSSFRMVQLVRRLLGIKKVGHTGTLDPFASGVLILCAGRSATRLIPQLMEGDKEYEATLRLGVTTDTQDPEGRVIDQRPVRDMDERAVVRCLAHFTGAQMQTPPAYSALKHKGRPMYYYARRGIAVTKEPRLIEIKELRCLSLNSETLTVRVVCSKGTYIRALAADIGEFLGCGAHLGRLIRIRNGLFSLAECLDGEQLFAAETGGSLLHAHHIPVDAARKLLADREGKN